MGIVDMIIKIEFHNKTNGSITDIECSWDSAGLIVQWYGIAHSGDDWTWQARGEA